MDRDLRTLWCGNLSNKVTEDILYELFLQAGPLDEVKIPKDNDSRSRGYGFVTYKHNSSVAYALELFRGTSLYNRELLVNRKIRLPAEQPIQQQNMFIQIPISTGMTPHNVLTPGFPAYALHNQYYCGSANMYPSNDRRNSSRNHPYYRN